MPRKTLALLTLVILTACEATMTTTGGDPTDVIDAEEARGIQPVADDMVP